jgi:2-amino-4-hydroxy-6-hydroxymethyldihydropteridine diphosphokinase
MKTPRATLAAGLALLTQNPQIQLLKLSPWYETAPVPASDQPWYVNAVAAVRTSFSPEELLARLHEIEDRFGRERGMPNAARSLDLDIVDYQRRVEVGPPILPHPRLETRAFVLQPLADIDPTWRHPRTGQDIFQLLAALPDGQEIRRLPE